MLNSLKIIKYSYLVIMKIHHIQPREETEMYQDKAHVASICCVVNASAATVASWIMKTSWILILNGFTLGLTILSTPQKKKKKVIKPRLLFPLACLQL